MCAHFLGAFIFLRALPVFIFYMPNVPSFFTCFTCLYFFMCLDCLSDNILPCERLETILSTCRKHSFNKKNVLEILFFRIILFARLKLARTKYLKFVENEDTFKVLFMECAKFCGWCGNVPSCLCRYFVGPNYFLVGISWVQIIFSWVFRGSKMFPCRYFEGPKFFLVGISWARNFFRGFKIFALG